MVINALVGCTGNAPRSRPSITVAAAANLTEAFGEIGTAFEADSGIHVVHSFASTGALARQIENGAPFDVFAAADVRHLQELERKRLLTANTVVVYARGRLAVWAAPASGIQLKSLTDLTQPGVRYIAIAKPELAPYGSAAIEALKNAGLWDQVERKVVYAENISMAKQYAATRNADASFTAYSLVLKSGGSVLLVDEKLHAPIEQALAVLMGSHHQDQALEYRKFVLGAKGRSILQRHGYQVP